MRGLFEHSTADGRGRVYATIPHQSRDAVAEFKSLNTREARIAFADHWLGIWAHDFELCWPAVYELLRLVEETELYKDPRWVGPGAPGKMHGTKPGYANFAEYFQDRLGHPLARWAEIEATYHYAQTYAPNLFKAAFSHAKDTAAQARGLGQKANGGELAIGDPKGGRPGKVDEKNDPPLAKGRTSAPRHVARLQRDRPDIVERLAAGEFRSVAEAVRYAKGETRGLTKLRRAWACASPEERAAFCAEICREAAA